MRSVVLVVLAAAIIAPAVPAAAQSPVRSTTSVSTSKPKIGFRAYGIIEGEALTAKKSFEAVLGGTGKSAISLVGAGGEVTRLWKGVFARVSVTTSSNDGSRVFIDSAGAVHSLNIPLKIEITPIEIGGGWRFESRSTQNKGMTVVPYVGAAILIQKYKETSTFASADENTDASDNGQAIFGGVELGFGLFKLGLEGKYRTVPDALGTAGSVSGAFNETNLGGAVFRVSFGVGFN